MRQQENQLAGMTDEMLESLSPKLKGLMGFKTHFGLGMVDGNSVDPSKFEQDFDWRYSKIVKMMSEAEWNQQVDYRGPRDEE